MRNSNHNARTTKWLMVAGLAVAGLTVNVAGCSSSNPTPTDAGSGSGGTTGGTGGHTGTGGSTTDSGVTHLVNYTFDTGLQTWALSTYPDPNGHNLAGAYTMDGGVDAAPVPVDAGAGFVAPTLTFDSAVGSPAGSLKMTATFTDYNQYVDAIVNLSPTINLTGKTLHASFQVTSGAFSGGAQLHVGTGATYNGYGQANITLAAPATFATVSFPILPPGASNPGVNAGFDPTMVIQIGVQAYSGAPVADAATYVNAGVPVTFNIDTITD